MVIFCERILMSENKFIYTHSDSKILVLESEALEELFKLVYDFCQNIKITISCIDNTTSELDSISNLIQYQNTSSREIYKISFRGDNSQCDPNKSVTLTIENIEIVSFENLYIDIEGSKKDVNQLKHDINDSISDMKAPFLYRILRNSLLPCAVITYITPYILNKLQIMLFLIFPLRIIFLLFFTVIIVNGFLSDKWSKIIKRKYLPTVIFAIGHGKKRYENKKYIIFIVITALVIPMLLYYFLPYLKWILKL